MAAGCCCASKITIGSAAVPNSSARFSRISTGSGFRGRRSRSSVRATGSAIYEARSARAAIAPVSYTRASARGSDIAAAGESDTELRYPGTCASKGLPEQPGLGLRVRLAPSVESFDDLLHGPQEQRPSEQCGDLLVRDRDGNWTYQFVATVDDFEQGVTLVIRGDDLLASTGRQIQLARLLGRTEPPQFLHHPLIMKTATQKLSKSDGDTGVRDLRARGWTAAAVREHAAALIDRPTSGGSRSRPHRSSE